MTTKFAPVLEKEEQKLTGIDWMKISLTCPTCKSNDLYLEPPHKLTWCGKCVKYVAPIKKKDKPLKGKLYQDKAWLVYQYVTLCRSTKEISDQLNISVASTRIYLKKFGIKIRGQWDKKGVIK